MPKLKLNSAHYDDICFCRARCSAHYDIPALFICAANFDAGTTEAVDELINVKSVNYDWYDWSKGVLSWRQVI